MVPRVRRVPLMGASWMAVAMVVATNFGCGCEAFVGTGTMTRVAESIAKQSTTSLWSSQDSVLLGGKLAVLQDVVKELDARHKELLERTHTTEKRYQQKLAVVQKDLEDSHDTIQSLEDDLAKTLTQQASDLQTKDRDHQEQLLRVQAQTEQQLQEFRNDYETNIVGNLKKELERKTAHANDLLERLTQAEETSSQTTDDTNAEVERLTLKIETLTDEIEASRSQTELLQEKLESNEQQLQETKQSAESDFGSMLQSQKTYYETRIQELEAKTKTIEEEYSNKLQTNENRHQEQFEKEETALRAKIDRLSSLNSDLGKAIDEDKATIEKLNGQIETQKQQLESVAASESASSERNTETNQTIQDLEAKHRAITDDYEAKLGAVLAENQKLTSDLERLVSESEEKVEIATAAVRASEKREQTLKVEYEALSNEVQRNWVLARLANLSSEKFYSENNGLLRENEELWNENEALKEALLEAKQLSLWSRVRSRLSRER